MTIGGSSVPGVVTAQPRARVVSDVPAPAPIGSVAKLYNPQGLRRWRAALADALFSTAVVTISGDSITTGVGADGSANPTIPGNDYIYRDQGYAGQLRALFAALYGDTGDGAWNGYDGWATWTAGAAQYASDGPNERSWRLNAATQQITFSLPACTGIEIWYNTGNSSGTITYAIDGGAPVNITQAGGGDTFAWTKVSINGLANAVHTLVLNGAAGADFAIAGVRAVRSTTGVIINRMGWSGSSSANAVGLDSANNASATRQQRLIHSYAKVGGPAHLVIFAYGVNDYGNQATQGPTYGQPGTNPESFQANVQTFVNSCVADGACVLLLGEPRSPGVVGPNSQQDFVDRMKIVANGTDHCAFLDVNDLWSGYPAASALGLYTTNSVHPTRPGHGDIARLLFNVLCYAIPDVNS